ncbi:MAG: MATE family efflux transporter [Ferruginibacter sp.]
MKSTISGFISPFKIFLNKGHERSVKAKKNIIASLLFRGLSIGISIIMVPITLNYITYSSYGIWLTLSSIVGWFAFFDIGLTQGLRNKFAEAKAKGEHELARIYVSTIYAVLTIIFFVVWVIFIIANNFLDWTKILSLPGEMASELSLLAVIVFTYFCIQFVLGIISTLVVADQQPAKESAINVAGQVLSFIIILILVRTTHGSLIKLSLALCASPIIVLVAANFIFFKGSLRNYKPSLKLIKFKYAKGLFNLGLVFFIIQVASIIQFQSANVIIARSFGSAEVTSYNIVYKYFGLINMVFMIFITPFWSASTEAFFRKDFSWIKGSMKKYNKLNLLLLIVAIIMLIFSDKIYTVWLNVESVPITFNLSLWGFIYFNVYIYGSKYVFFLNGINALRIQFWSSLVSPVVYILIALLLINYFKIGVASLFIASILANFNAIVIAPLQYHMIINKKKKGIWIR